MDLFKKAETKETEQVLINDSKSEIYDSNLAVKIDKLEKVIKMISRDTAETFKSLSAQIDEIKGKTPTVSGYETTQRISHLEQNVNMIHLNINNFNELIADYNQFKEYFVRFEQTVLRTEEYLEIVKSAQAEQSSQQPVVAVKEVGDEEFELPPGALPISKKKH